ncbi:hypothetical protein CLU79DRAFT_747611 [Phycomyces nitens]|nr:hypothetical protein CLU79DRAFT_747611 [Phycomyces nitens]
MYCVYLVKRLSLIHSFFSFLFTWRLYIFTTDIFTKYQHLVFIFTFYYQLHLFISRHILQQQTDIQTTSNVSILYNNYSLYKFCLKRTTPFHQLNKKCLSSQTNF